MVAFVFLVINGVLFELGGFYWLGIFIVAGLFLYEHSLIKEKDLSKLDIAFFNMNGYISVVVFMSTLLNYIA